VETKLSATTSDLPPEWKDPLGLGQHMKPSIDILAKILANWKIVAGIMGCALAVGVTLVWMAGKVFTAEAEIEIEPQDRRVVRVDSVLGDFGTDRSVIDGQIELIQSPTIARRVIADLGLFKDLKRSSPNEEDPSTINDEQLQAFLSSLKVERVGLTYLVNISYQSRDSKLAAACANAVGREYIDQLSKEGLNATREATQWLQSQIDQMRDKLHAAEQRVQQYRLDHNLVQIGPNNLTDLEISEYAKKIVDSRTKVLEASARVRLLDLIGDDKRVLRGLDFVAESKLFGDLQKQYAELKAKAADLRLRFGASHPDVAIAESQLDELDKQIDEEVLRIVASERQSLTVAQKEAALLDDDFVKLKEQVSRQNLDTTELGELERDLEATRALYVNFLTRLKETSAQESLPSQRATFVSEADVPSRSARPKSLETLAVSGLIGLLFGCLVALVFGRNNRSTAIGSWAGTSDRTTSVVASPAP